MLRPLVICLALFAAACTPSTEDGTTTVPENAPATTTTVSSPSNASTTTTAPTTTSTVAETTTTTAAPTTTTAAPQTTTTVVITTTTTAPANNPPVVEIVSPTHLSAHVAAFDSKQKDFGAYVSLSALTSDPDGDPVTVVWTSSLKGQIGSGESLVAWISTNGSDTVQPFITATVTDPAGASTEATVQIIVWIPSDS